jgi:outer membrane protein assembly factor BamB
MVVAALLVLACAQDVPRAPGHWPQWRGPNRDAVSTETGLLESWPEGGPPLLWTAEGLGEGVSNVAVGGGLVFMIGMREGREYATALDGAGKTVWSVAIGSSSGEHPAMRFVTMRTPTVDDDRVYVLSWEGTLHCLRSADGRVVWKASYASLGGTRGGWGWADFPLVDGNFLVCSVGGGTLVALQKLTGQPIWRSPRVDRVDAAIVPSEIGKVRQYVVFGYSGVAGVVAKTGQLAWKADRPGQTAVVPTPIVHNGIVLVASGFGVGCNAFRVTAEEGRFSVAPAWSGKQLRVHHGGMVRVGDHVYALVDDGALKCVALRTGEEVWQDRSVGKGSIMVADGRLICRGEGGGVALVEAVPDGYCERSRFLPPPRPGDGAKSHPVVAGGRLYLRSEGTLFCYDVRGPDYKEPSPVWTVKLPKPKPPAPAEPPGPEPPAAFVPTPSAVVERMLEMASVTKDDVVYDLGSGDGRILIAAAKKHGCKAVGYEIQPLLVEQSRLKVREAGLAGLVTIEEKDLFTADLSAATVVTLYLGERNNAKLLPQLAKLKAGARIVSHAHLLGAGGPKPELTVTLKDPETGSEHTIHAWTAPLKE